MNPITSRIGIANSGGRAADFLRALQAREPVTEPVALVVAHPDDEVIGVGGMMPLLRSWLLVHVTDGAPRDLAHARRAGFADAAGYAKARRQELMQALSLANAAPQMLELGVPDQRASFNMPGLARQLAEAIARFGARLILTHPYEGGHPDHDATCLAVHRAAARLGVPVVEMTSYHAGQDGGFEVGCFLGDEPGVRLELDQSEQRRKRAMLDAFTTQRTTLAPFGVAHEAFRIAPRYDFTAPPHDGTLLFERHKTRLTGTRWRALARTALVDD